MRQIEMSRSRGIALNHSLSQAMHVLAIGSGAIGVAALLASVPLQDFVRYMVMVVGVVLVGIGLAAVFSMMDVRGSALFIQRLGIRDCGVLCAASAANFILLWSVSLYAVVVLAALCIVAAQFVIRRAVTSDG